MFTAIEVPENMNKNGAIVTSSLILFFIALIANIATLIKITIFYLKSNGSTDIENQKRIKKNIKLFFQTVLQDFLYFVDNIFTFEMG
uniref:7TM_GPCR_Srx domain-containing protein n=1 Tax=Caenorhabditis japonica TaxID=281687 RepID=A0A8R1EH62_CAEJA